MTRLDAQIAETQETLSNLRAEKRREKLLNVKKSAPAKRGRPAINEDVLIAAVKLAETKTLANVAMKLDIGRATLYKYGISRARLENKTRC